MEHIGIEVQKYSGVINITDNMHWRNETSDTIVAFWSVYDQKTYEKVLQI